MEEGPGGGLAIDPLPSTQERGKDVDIDLSAKRKNSARCSKLTQVYPSKKTRTNYEGAAYKGPVTSKCGHDSLDRSEAEPLGTQPEKEACASYQGGPAVAVQHERCRMQGSNDEIRLTEACDLSSSPRLDLPTKENTHMVDAKVAGGLVAHACEEERTFSELSKVKRDLDAKTLSSSVYVYNALACGEKIDDRGFIASKSNESHPSLYLEGGREPVDDSFRAHESYPPMVPKVSEASGGKVGEKPLVQLGCDVGRCPGSSKGGAIGVGMHYPSLQPLASPGVQYRVSAELNAGDKRVEVAETLLEASHEASFSPGDSFWDELIEVEQAYADGKGKMGQGPLKTSMEVTNSSIMPPVLVGGPESIGDEVKFPTVNGLPDKKSQDLDAIGVQTELSPLPVRQISFSPMVGKDASAYRLDAPPLCKSGREDGGIEAAAADVVQAACPSMEADMAAVAAAKLEQRDPAGFIKRCHLMEKQGASSIEEDVCKTLQKEGEQDLAALGVKQEKAMQLKSMTGKENTSGPIVLLPSERVENKVTETEPVPFQKQMEEMQEKVEELVEVLEEDLQLSAWIPSVAAKVYAKKGINTLYRWQVECLRKKGVLEGSNLVYCASTSAGKSLVAEILMVRRLMSHHSRTCLLVLPYVALCSEKVNHMEAVLEPLGKRVRSFFGMQGGSTLPKEACLAVCTIEKANSLVNKLLEEGRLSEIALVVIDELHMVGDADRGYLLELLLTKLRYASGEGESGSQRRSSSRTPTGAASSGGSSSGGTSSGAYAAERLQIVGMSATMPNVAAIANWLKASLYQTDFRPVPLEEFMKIGNGIYDKEWRLIRMLPKEADRGGKDQDHVVELCHEVVKEGHSVLVFCSSRKGCESSAQHIARLLPSMGPRPEAAALRDEGPADGMAAVEELRKTPAGLDPVLAKSVPAGVAYHHAGLTGDEREVVEACFKRGVIRVLCATSTLAAGVNLPARRVIFRHPVVGREFLDATQYRQMAGRAGRAGIDTKGESILILRPEQQRRAALMLEAGCPPLQSCLTQERRGMTRALLEVVAGALVQTPEEVQRYVRCTLLASTKPFEEVVKPAQEALRWLCVQKFVEWDAQQKMYVATPLGRAAFSSSLTPEEALTVFEDLAKARKAFVLASDLHVLYQVTPIYVGYDPDWGLFYRRFVELPPIDQSVGNFVGVTEGFLMRMAHGGPMMQLKSRMSKGKGGGAHGESAGGSSSVAGSGQQNLDECLRVCRRFFVCLILSQLIQEVPLSRVCELFEVPKGTVQGLQDQAGRFGGMVAAFCERLGWSDMEAIISKFQSRVSFGVRSEIVDLTALPFVKAYRARALYRAGFRTPQAVAEASPSEIAKALSAVTGGVNENRSAAFRQRVEMILARKIVNGARKKVLEQVDEARTAAFSALRALGMAVPADLAPMNTETLNNGGAPPEAPADSHPADHSKESRQEATADLEAAVTSPIRPRPKRISNGADPLEQPPLPLPISPTNASPKLSPRSRRRLSVGKKAEAGETSLLFGRDTILMQGGEGPESVGGGLVGKQCEAQGKVAAPRRSGPVDVDKMEGGFAAFYEHWAAAEDFVFDLHLVGSTGRHADAFEIEGMAIAWPASVVYYVNLARPPLAPAGHVATSKRERRLKAIDERWEMVAKVFKKTGTRKIAWDLKMVIRVLRSPILRRRSSTGASGGPGPGTIEMSQEGGLGSQDGHRFLPRIEVADSLVDIRVVAWLLNPDEESSLPASKMGLEQMVVRKLPADLAAEAARDGRWTTPGGRAAHNGCCRRVSQVRALHSLLWKMLPTESLLAPFTHVEMPLARVLADMEGTGIAVDLGLCVRQRQTVERKLRDLERKAHSMAGGIAFSLTSPAEVADILYRHLALPLPPGCAKGKNHPSTDKQALEFLKDNHPIAAVIMEHRSLSKLVHTTLGQITYHARPAGETPLKGCVEGPPHQPQQSFLFGRWLQTATATGRLSMEEPNLQCVENEIRFTSDQIPAGLPSDGATSGKETTFINPRNIFVPSQPGWVFLTADYSQIELRLMAHFSRDRALMDLFTSPSGDVFRMIASRWSGLPESAIDDRERTRAKRLAYGILYGMGVTTLADAMACTPDQAQRYSQQFLSAFPGVSQWMQQSVESCRQTGYIETLAGRRRYLERINSRGQHGEQARAERQAVNSICQGSAADLVKHAMVLLQASLQTPPLAGNCRLLLQIHDELLLEVNPVVVNEAAVAVRTAMEGAATLQVPLCVKVQVGPSWGSLEVLKSDASPKSRRRNSPYNTLHIRSPAGPARVLESDVSPILRGG